MYNIYEGIITQPINVIHVQPDLTFLPSQINPTHNPVEGTINALKFRFPLNYLKYEKILMPCIPAHEQELCSTSLEKQHTYILKVPYQTEHKIIASGKRSAILGDGHRLLRFKGCGNETKGFNLEKDEVRGCHFFHTAKRQLYMTHWINELLRGELKIDPPANIPLYCYNFPTQYEGVMNELPLISKYCCVFETRGDRRAGTHLISPLEMLFVNMFNFEPIDWKKMIDEKSRLDEGEVMEFVANFLFMEDDRKFIDVYDQSPEITNYFLIQDVKPLTYLQKFEGIMKTIIEKFVPQPYKNHVQNLVQKMEHWVQCIETIIKRIGWEMGQIKRVMCEKGVNWGFFLDHGTEWHCNAHLNNFLVTEPSEWTPISNYFLLPLDYDFAFTKDEFVNIELESQGYGKNDQAMFENYLCAEFSAMEMGLFGLEIMDFTYSIHEEEKPSQSRKMAKITFRDTLVQAFNAGMRSKQEMKEEIQNGWNQHVGEIRNLVEICLYISVGFQT